MADISYGGINRYILFHILSYFTEEIRIFSNISLCNVERTHHLIWQTIGVGTFLKVGGPDSIGHCRKLLRPKPHLPPKSVFSLDFGHFIFAKMPKMFFLIGKNRKKLQTFRGRLPSPTAVGAHIYSGRIEFFYSKQSTISVANCTKSQLDHQISDNSHQIT